MPQTKTKVQRAVEHIFTHPGTRSSDLAPIFGCAAKDVPAFMKDVMKLDLIVSCRIETPDGRVVHEYRPSAAAPSKAPDLKEWRASHPPAIATPCKPRIAKAARAINPTKSAVTTQAGSGDVTPASAHSVTHVVGGSSLAGPPPEGAENVIEAAKRDEMPVEPASDRQKDKMLIDDCADKILRLEEEAAKREAYIDELEKQLKPHRGKTIHIDACPFCGFDDVEIDEVRIGEFAVDCPECEAIGPIKPSQMEAISYWNDRRGA